MHILLSVFLSIFYAGFTHAQTWYYPDPNTVPTFNNIDVVNASWSVPATSSPSAYLWLWCTPNGIVSYKLEFNVSVPFDGNRLVTLNYGSNLNCHFEITAIKIPTGSFHIQENDQPPVTWAPLPDPSPTTSTSDAPIASSLGAPVASSTITSGTSSSSTLSLNTAATTARSLVLSDSSLSKATSLMTSRPNLYIAPKSMNVTTVSSSSLPSTLLQPASKVITSGTLSIGAKAGIIVAVIAVVAISAINILYCIRTRIKCSRLRSEPAEVAGDQGASTQWSSELQGPEVAVEKDGSGSTTVKNVWELQ